MGDFERELQRLVQEREAREKAQRQTEEAKEFERLAGIERAENLKIQKISDRLELVERHVRPVQRMVEGALRVLGDLQWGSDNYGIEVKRYDDRSPYPTNALARFEVGHERYNHLRKYGLFFKPTKRELGEWKNIWIPIGQPKKRREDDYLGRLYFGVTLFVNSDDEPFFGDVSEDGLISAKTQGTKKDELEGLLLKQFQTGGPWYRNAPRGWHKSTRSELMG